jgi:hypothetical protein
MLGLAALNDAVPIDTSDRRGYEASAIRNGEHAAQLWRDRSTFEETRDPSGTRVVLRLGVWREKIIRDHPEIALHLTDILQTVARPDHTAADPSYEDRARYYGRDVGPSRWLLVVVSYEQTPARIVSAFANRKDPRSWSA